MSKNPIVVASCTVEQLYDKVAEEKRGTGVVIGTHDLTLTPERIVSRVRDLIAEYKGMKETPSMTLGAYIRMYGFNFLETT